MSKVNDIKELQCKKYEIQSLINGREILGYDCDGNEIKEFRILRFPFSEYIENWNEEPNIDPRLYCVIKSSTGDIYAISVYDDWICNQKFIRKYEQLDINESIPTLIKTISEMSYYEVAFCGIKGDEWYYDRDKFELRKKLDCKLKEQASFVKKISKNK